MENGYNQNIPSPNNETNEEVKVVKTDIGAKDGQNKCPKCGATDISLNINNGNLRCNFCRHEFVPEKLEGMQDDLSHLQGQVIASGATDIAADTSDLVTLKCSSCGAEVVIDTSSTAQARCHWCRNTLSLNQQIPNGSIPDVLLPFKITKEEARKEIESFVKKRKFYAHPKFTKEFTTENIMGVYFSYMIVDVNSHVLLSGNGEHLVREYTEGSDENRETYYDADLYAVEREFDLVIDGLTIESNSDKLNKNSKDKTNNIINSIMPFDIENCIKFNANYLKGYTSEKRDTNIEQLKPLIERQSKDIARFSINNTLDRYDRGVAWKQEEMNFIGQQWKSAYLPVWLYSYLQVKGNKKVLHYVAVNARTKETMGSVPIHIPKLFGVSFFIECLGIVAMMNIDFDNNWLFLLVGFIYFFMIYIKYRNNDVRHKYELETKTNVQNLHRVDHFIQTERRLKNFRMKGANNTNVSDTNISSSIINSLVDNNELASFIKNNNDKNQKGGNL